MAGSPPPSNMRRRTHPGLPCPKCDGKGVTENVSLFLDEPEFAGQSHIARRYAVCRACWKLQYKERYGKAPPQDAIVGEPPELDA